MPAHAARRPSPPAASSVFRRTGLALSHLWRRRRPELPSTRHDQLTALTSILDEAVAAQPVADEVVADCGRPGPVSAAVAQTGGEQISVYHKLNTRLRELPVDDDLDDLKQRGARLLAYHQWLLHQALNLAFATNPDARVEAIRQRMRGLGDPAVGLRDLREEARELRDGVRGEGTPR